MATSEKGKYAEGMEYVRQAEKSLKTSLFKWRPDVEGAAMDFSNAATCFKNAKALSECKDCLIKASNCYKQHQSLFSSAKALEQAALVAKDMGDFEESVKMIEQACALFLEHGSPDSAALSYEKGAKMIESKLPDKGAHLYLKAADVVQLEDRPRQAADYLDRAARLMLKVKMYDEAANTMSREIDMHLSGDNRPAAGRLFIALILVHLTRGDLIEAQKVYKNGLSMIDDEQAQIIETILEAYDQEDDEMAAQALNTPFLMHMDVEYAKLARNLAIPNNLSDASDSRKVRSSSSANTSLSKLGTKQDRNTCAGLNDKMRNAILDEPIANSDSNMKNKRVISPVNSESKVPADTNEGSDEDFPDDLR